MGPDKNCDFGKNCENFEYCKICEKLENSMSQCKPVEEGVERAPTRTAALAKTAKIAKNEKSAKIRKLVESVKTCRRRG